MEVPVERKRPLPIEFLMMPENQTDAWMIVGRYLMWCDGSHSVH